MADVETLSVLDDRACCVLENRARLSRTSDGCAILGPDPGTRDSKRFADGLMRRMQKRPIGAPFLYRYRAAGEQGMPRLEAVDENDIDEHCHRGVAASSATDAQPFWLICRLHSSASIARARSGSST